MRVMIVGGRSALAQALKPALAEFAEVITAGRHGCDVSVDLAASPAAIALPVGLDAVVNAAALASGDTATMESVNALGVLKLCRACAKASSGGLVQVSSIFATLAETSPFFGAYALSKRHGEELARLACSESGLPLAILRPSRLYGVGAAQRRHQPLLGTIIDRAAVGADIEFHGGHDAVRNFLHIDDLAVIVARVVRHGVTGTFNCLGGEDLPLSAIAAAAIAAFGSTSRVCFRRDLPAIPDCVFPADDRLYERIGIRPSISMVQGMGMEATQGRAAR